MKKRILTLLLAGLLAMSAIACNTPTENPNLTGNTPTGETTTPPVTDESGYQVVNETVYALVDELNLRAEASTAGDAAKKVSFGTEMTRIKYGSRWSVVKYDGTEYYVMSDYITTDDLGLKTFTSMTDTLMHATTAGVNVRVYPTTNTLVENNVYKKLTLNETVTVIAKNSDWYQIRLDGKKYYVSTQYFAEGEVPSVNDLGDYKAKFEAGKLDTPTTMYVTASSVNVRSLPSAEDYSTPISAYLKGTAVTVVAVAKINGSRWAQIDALTDPNDPASASVTGYIRYDLLSLVKEADNSKLESLLTAYNFVEYDEDKTMWVASDIGSLRIRTSPIVPEGDTANDNVYGSLAAKTKVTVVAYGVGDYEGWSLIAYDEGWYFVSSAYITTNENGVASLKSDSYKSYSGFTAYTGTATKTVKTGGAYTFLTPDLNSENKQETLAAGSTVTVIAEGTYGSVNYQVFFVKDANGTYWFIDQNKVN